jgi:predicted component of type VI protein secretion system
VECCEESSDWRFNQLIDLVVTMVSKTLFEKLAFPGELVAVNDSVLRNIRMIFNSPRLLDGEQGIEANGALAGLEGSVPGLVDQCADTGPDLSEYKRKIEQLIMRFEPRVEVARVESLSYAGVGAGKCKLKLRIYDIDVVQDFVF